MIPGYRAACEEAALAARLPRVFLRVDGRAPIQMLSGILTSAMPRALTVAGGILKGRAPYSAILTPKGRLLTDLRVHRLENGDEGSLLLDLPASGLAGALAHFEKYLPPRMAQASALREPADTLTVVGPSAPEVLARATGLEGHLSELRQAGEGREWVLPDGSETALRVVRSHDVIPPAFDVIASANRVRDLRAALLEDGVVDGGHTLWHVLRLEKGRPAFDMELDEQTMPAEAGIQERCIDVSKGCFVGQEVVVRLRDRGHTNRKLRGLLLGQVALPKKGAELFADGRKRAAGTVMATAVSPRFRQGIALAYLRREVEPPTTVSLHAHDGPAVAVRALSDGGWLMVAGDPTFYP